MDNTTAQAIISQAETMAKILENGDKVQLAGTKPLKVFAVKTKKVGEA